MEAKKIPTIYHEVCMFLASAKALHIPYTYTQEQPGKWSCWTDMLNAHGEGATLEECQQDLIDAMRDIAQVYFSDLTYWLENMPDDFTAAVKVMFSTDEELKSCLDGKI